MFRRYTVEVFAWEDAEDEEECDYYGVHIVTAETEDYARYLAEKAAVEDYGIGFESVDTYILRVEV